MDEPAMSGGTRVQFAVADGDTGGRLDRWLADRMPEHSRSRIQAWIRDGRVLVDGAPPRASLLLVPGQQVELEIPGPEPPRLQPEAIPLSILHEDEHVIVVIKPAGLQVHPGAGPPHPTLAHALLHRYPGWEAPGPPERPGIVHRLDRDTSGLMLVARTPLAYQMLGRQIMARAVTRRYVALVWGHPELDSGRVAAPIARDPRDRRRMAVRRDGRPAATQWRVLRRFDTLSLLDLVLETGRTHQIRVHLAHLGHPVFADPVYGGVRGWPERVEAKRRPAVVAALRRLHRQALHAYHLAFRHPAGGRWLRFEAPVPGDMDEILMDLMREESER